MIPKDNHEALLLDKVEISSKEIIVYLETLNSKNQSIFDVLTRKPALPDVNDLPWVKEYKMDKNITNKLKHKSVLTQDEKNRLLITLSEAATFIKRAHRKRGVKMEIALETYISSLYS